MSFFNELGEGDLQLAAVRYASQHHEFTSADLAAHLKTRSHTARGLLRALVDAGHINPTKTENRYIHYSPTAKLLEVIGAIEDPLRRLRVTNLAGDRISIGMLFRRISVAGPLKCVPAVAADPRAFFQTLVDLYSLAVDPDDPELNPLDVRADLRTLAAQATNLAAVANAIADAGFWGDLEKLPGVLLDLESITPDDARAIIAEWNASL